MSGGKGFILLTVLLLCLSIMSMLVAMTLCLQRSSRSFALEKQRVLLRYYAEAGLAYAAVHFSGAGQYTDAAGPVNKSLKLWLLSDVEAGGSRGCIVRPVGSGGWKMVKIAGHSELYSIGFIGADLRTARYKLVIREISGKRSIL